MLTVKNLHVTFFLQGQPLHAVRGVSFEIGKGEAIGIVGESGSGKSASMQAVTGLTSAAISGEILFEGQKKIELGKKIGMVFQDPMTSLNPTMKIGAQISEGIIYHKLAPLKEARERAIELLQLVGISDPKMRAEQYPHEFSGGMRQRVLIAIAIACNPRLLIADEPTTALDAIVQAQILDLIQRMQSHFQMGLILISHDFKVIAKVCKKILVMYAGKIIEQGTVEEILHHPQHPYTQMLLNSSPRFDQSKSKPLQVINGSPPNPLLPIKGCSFKERCPYAAIQCSEEPTGPVACWRVL